MGIVLDVVPNHMAADDGTASGPTRAARAVLRRRSRRPAATGASSTSTTSPASARRTRGVRGHPRAGARRSCARAFVDGLRVDHPDGLADPAGYLRGCASAARERVWVEKILDPGEQLRDWPVRGTVGYEFLNDVCGAVRRSRRRGAADRAVGADLRRPRGRSARWRSRPSSSRLERTVRAGARAARAGVDPGVGREDARSSRAGARCRCTGPTSTRERAASTTRPRGAGRGTGRRGRRAAAARARRRRRSSSPASSRRRRRSWPRASRTPPSTATCGCWRSTTSAATRAGSASTSRRFHAGEPRARRAVPAETCSTTHDPRHQALGRRARADRRAAPDGRASGASTSALAGADRAAARPAGAPDDVERYLIFQTLVGRLADRARADRRLHGEGAARGQAQHELDRARTPTGRTAVKRFCRALLAATPRSSTDSSRSSRGSARAGDRAALGQLALKLTVPGRAGHLPGRRAAVPRAGRPRQPPAGRLGCEPRR